MPLGNWDNAHVVFALLPEVLRAGDNPADFQTGSFPVYNGPKASVVNGSSFEGKYHIIGDQTQYDLSGQMKYSNGILSNLTEGALQPGLAFSSVSADEIVELFDKNSNYTIEAWIYHDDSLNSNQHGLTGWWVDGDGSATNFGLSLKISSGKMFFRMGFTSTIVRYTSAVISALSVPGLHHFVFVKTGSVVTLYMDSILQGILSSTAWVDGAYNVGGGLINWGLGSVGSNYHNGFSALVIHKKVLSSDTIFQNFVLGPGLGGLVGAINGDILTVTEPGGDILNVFMNPEEHAEPGIYTYSTTGQQILLNGIFDNDYIEMETD